MEKKILFGTLGGAVTGTLMSMVIYMGIFGGMTEQWMAEHGSCLKEMDTTWWFVGGLLQGLFYALLLHKMGVNTFQGGMIAGGWISFLLTLFIGISMASTFTAYPWSWLPYDVGSNTIIGILAGGVTGWIYGKLK